MTKPPLLSTLIFSTIGLSSKVFLNFLCKDVKVVGLQRLLQRLEDVEEDGRGRGVLTVSNHISVCDEPITWGILPISHVLLRKPMRWTLGASDVLFTRPLFSSFFSKGQVLETVRGAGIRQEAVDKSIRLLDEGQWIHIFPEGKITQPSHSNLSRLKWGIGRMLMETRQIPTIIPMWITGFDQVLDETRGWPKPIPRPGKRVSITFGTQEDSAFIEDKIAVLLRERRWKEEKLSQADEDKLRSDITAIIKEGLERVGARVSGEVQKVKEGKEV
ncbi:hypothetical protein M422DRAFT_38362 [Sphaerobolus stellatus SS14]|uniref:Tafazzin family protein n=1 Tax=Sphaerobolus stellatus (strain SS14) TaxID=990650 RepID=A0A0C9TWA4_SPHS4|nr:hypothetical protein M422DRAFT_38362 [Sphaerobolus stellatus SS14]